MADDAPRRDPIVEALEQRLGVAITNAELALAALTHKSFVNEHRGEPLQDNERLEFLGDAVLNLAVSQRLMERFPGAREGELSKIRAAVVDEPGLAQMARELDLGAVLRLGRGEELTGGRAKSSLLADAMEAVVAALFLGGGLDPVLTLIDRFLGDAFAQATAGTLDRDYKTQLQELAQSRIRAAPRYRVVAEHGPDHSKTFEVELEIGGDSIAKGSGRSKKDAEQAAARLALDRLRPPPAPPPVEADAVAASSAPEPTVEPAAPVAAPIDVGEGIAPPPPPEPPSPPSSAVAVGEESTEVAPVASRERAAAPRRRSRSTAPSRRPGRKPTARPRPRARKPRRK